MIAMPFVIASLLYNVALGVINRAMPQLMVSLVGAPALSLGGLVLLALVSPLALSIWLAAMNGFIAAPFTALP
jgi:flagellar biosynthetic protein FliR